MALQRVAGACFWIAVASTGVAGQQGVETNDRAPQAPATSVIERTYHAGGLRPWRQAQTRTTSGSQETVVETEETSGVEARFEPIQQVRTETTRTGPGVTKTRRDIFGFGPSRQRTLLKRIQSERESLADGSTSTVRSTWAPDLNGRLSVASRLIERTASEAPDIRRAGTTLLLPGIDGRLREYERTESTERQIQPGVVRYESTRLVHDMNGRWEPTETRRGELRETGPGERLEEETIRSRDVSGTLAVVEKSVTRRSEVDGREQVVIETYAQPADGIVVSEARLKLSHRVRRTTMATVDGGSHTVEEVEARSPVAASDAMRVIRRTVATVRRTGPDRLATEKQVFELDVNGRLVSLFTENEETAGISF